MKTYVRYTYNVTSQSRIFGALIQEIDGLDVDIYYFYDSTDGKLLATVNSDEDNGICYSYDGMGRLVGVMPATYESTVAYGTVTDAESVTYTYNSKNLLSTITTDSTTYTFTYDVFGNTTSVSAGANELAEYTYGERNGKLKKITYGNGYVVEYVYNELELLTQICYTKGTEPKTLAYEYEYTSDGQVYKFIDHENEKSTVYKYDTNNRLVAFIEYDNTDYYHDYSATILYNDKGELSSSNYVLNHTNGNIQNDSAEWSYSYTYENDGRLDNLRIRTANTDGNEYYYYDEYERVSGKRNYFTTGSGSSTRFDNQINYTYTAYNGWATNQISSYSSSVNGSTALTYTYTYDQNENITKISYSTGQEIRYVYDDLGQLLREDNGLLNKTYVYTYDNAGNIIYA